MLLVGVQIECVREGGGGGERHRWSVCEERGPWNRRDRAGEGERGTRIGEAHKRGEIHLHGCCSDPAAIGPVRGSYTSRQGAGACADIVQSSRGNRGGLTWRSWPGRSVSIAELPSVWGQAGTLRAT